MRAGRVLLGSFATVMVFGLAAIGVVAVLTTTLAFRPWPALTGPDSPGRATELPPGADRPSRMLPYGGPRAVTAAGLPAPANRRAFSVERATAVGGVRPVTGRQPARAGAPTAMPRPSAGAAPASVSGESPGSAGGEGAHAAGPGPGAPVSHRPPPVAPGVPGGQDITVPDVPVTPPSRLGDIVLGPAGAAGGAVQETAGAAARSVRPTAPAAGAALDQAGAAAGQAVRSAARTTGAALDALPLGGAPRR